MIYFRDTFLGKETEVRVAYMYMLDTKDIQVLQEMFGMQRKEFKKELLLLDTKIDRVYNELTVKMDHGFAKVRDEILTTMHRELYAVRGDVIDVINMNVIPQLSRFDARITRLERLQSQV